MIHTLDIYDDIFNLQGQAIPFYMSAFLAGLGGFAGGFVGNPADLVNVRMQNDVKLPPEQRRKCVLYLIK